MTVVVTGAAGFIGSHLVEALAARGERVVAIDRRPDMPAAAGVRIVADLVDAAAGVVDDLLWEPTRYSTSPLEPACAYRETSRTTSKTTTMAAASSSRTAEPARTGCGTATTCSQPSGSSSASPMTCRWVVTSSSAVYGGSRHGRACHAHDPLRPGGGYARSKVALEARCYARACRGGLVAVARPFTVAGERQRPDMAIAQWIQAIRAGRPIRILGAPDRTRDVTDVRDVVTGLLRLADRGVHGTVNLGTGTAHRLATIARAVAAVFGHPARFAVEPADPADVPDTLADTRRCQHLLGLVPRTDLDALVRRQVAATLADCSPTVAASLAGRPPGALFFRRPSAVIRGARQMLPRPKTRTA